MVDGLAVEREVQCLFGPHCNGETRNRVPVATKVVEQSLDIDFDLIVSDLAPADLLIQRACRLWRRDRGVTRRLAEPELPIVSPESVTSPGKDWIMSALPGTGSGYRDNALLRQSAREVFCRGALVTPDDMRPLIEVVFDRERRDAVPSALATSDNDAYGAELSRIGLAR